MDVKNRVLLFTIEKVLEYIMEEKGVTLLSAIHMLYSSKTFLLLQNFDTALYYESPSYTYDLLEEELKTGKIVRIDY